MPTPFRMLDKEIQRNFKKRWINLTGGQFNAIYNWYAQQIKWRGSYNKEYLGSLLGFPIGSLSNNENNPKIQEMIGLLQCVDNRIAREKAKSAIVAETEGKMSLEDLRKRFPMIKFSTTARTYYWCVLRCRPKRREDGTIDYGEWVNTHGEKLFKKDYYSLDEVKPYFDKLIKQYKNYADETFKCANLCESLLEEACKEETEF